MKKTLVFVAGAALALACNKKTEDNKQPAPKPTKPTTSVATSMAPTSSAAAAPAKVTPDALVKRMMECNDPAKYADCYTADAKIEFTDGPTATGAKGVEELLAPMLKAFPDWKYAPGLVLVNGKNVAAVVYGGGTNSAPFMGAPATNKKAALVGLRQVTFTDDGQKISSQKHTVDGMTVVAQIGLAPNFPARKVEDLQPPASPTIVAAADTPAERDNVALIQKQCDAWNKHDAKAIVADWTDDAVMTDYTVPKDTKGTKDIGQVITWIFQMFPDMNSTCKAWGAGDYVFNEVEWQGTNKGAVPEMGMPKATNKPVKVHDAEIYEIKNGKIDHYWRFSNQTAMLQQMGLIPAAPPAPAAPAAASTSK